MMFPTYKIRLNLEQVTSIVFMYNNINESDRNLGDLNEELI